MVWEDGGREPASYPVLTTAQRCGESVEGTGGAPPNHFGHVKSQEETTMRLTRIAAAFVATGALVAGNAHSQAKPDNLGTLKQFKVATTDLNIPTIPQTGKNADGFART